MRREEDEAGFYREDKISRFKKMWVSQLTFFRKMRICAEFCPRRALVCMTCEFPVYGPPFIFIKTRVHFWVPKSNFMWWKQGSQKIISFTNHHYLHISERNVWAIKYMKVILEYKSRLHCVHCLHNTHKSYCIYHR